MRACALYISRQIECRLQRPIPPEMVRRLEPSDNTSQIARIGDDSLSPGESFVCRKFSCTCGKRAYRHFEETPAVSVTSERWIKCCAKDRRTDGMKMEGGMEGRRKATDLIRRPMRKRIGYNHHASRCGVTIGWGADVTAAASAAADDDGAVAAVSSPVCCRWCSCSAGLMCIVIEGPLNLLDGYNASADYNKTI